MRSLAHSAYLDSQFNVPSELPRAGSSLENPYAFDAAAREIKALAERGLVEIVEEHTSSNAQDLLIDRLRFKRLR